LRVVEFGEKGLFRRERDLGLLRLYLGKRPVERGAGVLFWVLKAKSSEAMKTSFLIEFLRKRGGNGGIFAYKRLKAAL
jgi:hypothetical protein